MTSHLRFPKTLIHAFRFRHLAVPQAEGFRRLFNEHTEAVHALRTPRFRRQAQKRRGFGRIKEVVGHRGILKRRVGHGRRHAGQAGTRAVHDEVKTARSRLRKKQRPYPEVLYQIRDVRGRTVGHRNRGATAIL